MPVDVVGGLDRVYLPGDPGNFTLGRITGLLPILLPLLQTVKIILKF